jgi:hypothetical protein
VIERQDRRALARADDPAVFLEKLISDFETILVKSVGEFGTARKEYYLKVMKGAGKSPFERSPFPPLFVAFGVRAAGISRLDQRASVPE